MNITTKYIKKFSKINVLIRLILMIFSTILSLWFLMWFFSSISLSSGYCDNEFSLFSSTFRCSQPYLAIIGLTVTTLSSVFILFTLVRKI
jgi:lysylphosphatidylglycerol synthetase-like protein (DUF2156 family)